MMKNKHQCPLLWRGEKADLFALIVGMKSSPSVLQVPQCSLSTAEYSLNKEGWLCNESTYRNVCKLTERIVQ